MKVKRLTSLAASLAIALSLGVVTSTTSTAAALDKVPFTITNNSGLNEPLFVGIMGENPATGRDSYLVPDGNSWRLQDIPTAAGYPSPPQPLPGAMFAGPANGQSVTVEIPHLTSGRVYYSWGQPLDFSIVQNDLGVSKIVYPSHHTEPDRSINHGSAEFTYDANDILWYNSTQVDYFGQPVQVGIMDEGGQIHSTGRVAAGGFDYVRNELASRGDWGKLIDYGSNGQVLRILNPSHKLGHDGFDGAGAQGYIDAVWEHYKHNDLRIRPIHEDQDILYTGRVGSDNIFRFTTHREFADVNIAKPTVYEALACAGPFTGGDEQGWIARTLCAGFNRTNLITQPDQPTTSDKFFTDPHWTNWYAKAVPEAMATGHAYSFAYADVGGYESLRSIPNPQHAYLQLDPVQGGAAPLGNEDHGSGDNGGGDNGGGDNGGGGPALPPGTGRISVDGRNLCVDIPWGNPANFTQVQIVNCTDNPAQQWTRSADGSISALGACLDVNGGGTANGTAVQVYQCNGTGAQKWEYNPATKALVNPQSGKCLDVPSSQFNDGQKLQIWNCNGTGAQRWNF